MDTDTTTPPTEGPPQWPLHLSLTASIGAAVVALAWFFLRHPAVLAVAWLCVVVTGASRAWYDPTEAPLVRWLEGASAAATAASLVAMTAAQALQLPDGVGLACLSGCWAASSGLSGAATPNGSLRRIAFAVAALQAGLGLVALLVL